MYYVHNTIDLEGTLVFSKSFVENQSPIGKIGEDSYSFSGSEYQEASYRNQAYSETFQGLFFR